MSGLRLVSSTQLRLFQRGWLAVVCVLCILCCSAAQAQQPEEAASVTESSETETPAIDPSWIQALIGLLDRDDTSRRAITELVDLGPAVLSQLAPPPYTGQAHLAQGHDETPSSTQQRWGMASAVGRIAVETGSLEAATTLARWAAMDPHPPVRYEALRWLVQTPEGVSGQIVAELQTLLAQDPSSWGAAVALALLGHDDGLDILHGGIRTADPFRRQEAVSALTRVHDQNTVRALAPMIVSPELRDRQEVALALGEIGGPEAYLLLLGAIRDEDSGVRWRACQSLGQLGDRRAMFSLQKLLIEEHDPKVRKHAEQAIEKLASLRVDLRGSYAQEIAPEEKVSNEGALK